MCSSSLRSEIAKPGVGIPGFHRLLPPCAPPPSPKTPHPNLKTPPPVLEMHRSAWIAGQVLGAGVGGFLRVWQLSRKPGVMKNQGLLGNFLNSHDG